MKINYTLFFLLLLSYTTFSQTLPDTVLMKENQQRFEKLQEEFRQRLLAQRNNPSKTSTNGTKIATSPNVKWQERGPNNNPSWIKKAIFDLNDLTGKKVWVSTFGGLWYNNDITQADTSWHLKDEIIGTYSIAQDPTNPLKMYASSFNSKLHKSIDGGVTWAEIQPNSQYGGELSVGSNGTLYMLWPQLVYYSTDGGTSILQLVNYQTDMTDNSQFTDVDFDYQNLVYVSLQNGKIYRSSTATGGTWTNIMTNPLSANSYVTKLAISKDNANNKILYALNMNSNGGPTNTNWLRKSINGGTTWTNLTVPTSVGLQVTAYTTNFDIQASNTNPNKVVISAGYLTGTINGGTTWKPLSSLGDYSIGSLQISPNDRVISANQNSISYTSNVLSNSVTTVNTRNKGLRTSLIYDVKMLNKYADSTIFASNSYGTVIMKNSSKISSGSILGNVNSGIYIDNDERNNNIFSQSQPTIIKDDGIAIKQLYSNIYGNLDYDEKNNILYQFRYASQINNETFIRRVRNVGSGKEIIDDVRLDFYLGYVVFVKALNQPNSFLIQGDGKLYKIIVDNANVATTTLLNDSNFPINYNHGAIVARNNDNLIYEAGNDGLFRSIDGGITWEEKFLSAGVQVQQYSYVVSATINPRNPNQVFVLTNAEIFYTNDVSVTSPIWIRLNGDLPNFAAGLYSIYYRETDGILAVGTFARGIFTTDYFKNTIANEIIFSKYETSFCKNNDAKITFFANGAFSQSNTYRLELSDINGNFTSPRVLTTSNDSPIYARIPTDIPSGANYHFRIVSTNATVPIISAVSDAISIASGTNLFAASYPQVVNPTDNGFVMNVKTAAAAEVYFVAIANNAAVPSATQIVAGQNKDGSTAFKADSAATVANEVQNIFVSGLSQGTDYDVYILTKLPNENCYSDFVKIDVQTRGITLNYCTPANTNGCAGNNYISSVLIYDSGTSSILQEFSTFNSGCNPANFSFNFANAPTIFSGIYYQLGFKIHDFIGSFPARKAAVWIDINNDGVFTNYEIFLSNDITQNPTNFNFVLPTNTSPGLKRLRIRVTDNANLSNYSPCDAYNAGETEDDLLNVQTNEPFIYANLDKEQVGQCEIIKVLSNVTGTYNEGNLFRVELSDKTGNFATPRVLLNNLANTLPVNIRLPKDIENGSNYQIRVVSTDPVATSFVSAGFTISPNTQNVNTNYSSGTVLVNHIGNISATNQISGTAKATYNAWNSVILLPNFKAESNEGGNFKAEIVGCEN